MKNICMAAVVIGVGAYVGFLALQSLVFVTKLPYLVTELFNSMLGFIS